MRTDDNRNPAAITTDIAKQAGLVLGTDYTQGAAFVSYAHTYYTARLLGDPVAQTIRVIDAIGYYTHAGAQRWTYIAIPAFVWATLAPDQKRDVVGYHYQREGNDGSMLNLFPNYGKLKI